MIVWPEETRLKTESRDALQRFRETSAAAELEAAPLTWSVTTWPWISELPQRITLESADHDTLSFTMFSDGIWLCSAEDRQYRFRSEEELERDAQALQPS